MSARNSSSNEHRRRVRASALLAAYGDALGFITELTDRAGLQRRAGVDHISRTISWQRRVGGQFGPMVALPAGSISDDTQLRLATCRSVGASGRFDVETFSEIELTVWPAYALGAGRGSLAAAAALRKRDVTWATNFFAAKGAEYLRGGGNGAAMRIQPHVWAAERNARPWSWLGDVLVNSVCTHGHPRGFVGAAFHAACVDHALRHGSAPAPENWLELIAGLEQIGDVARADERLAEIWLRQWERRTGQALPDAVASVLQELTADARTCSRLSRKRGPGSYIEAVDALRAFEAAQRGSGTKTSLLAAVNGWLFEGRSEEGLRVCADAIGTDTDSIASMAGAILGATDTQNVPGELQDRTYITREADRMWAAGSGLRPPRFPYPDVLSWKAPRSATDAVAAEEDLLYVAGLGPGGAQSEAYTTSGKTPGVWQWIQLWYGQSLLVKRRARPAKLISSQRVKPLAAYVQADLLGPSDTGTIETRASERPAPLREAKRPSTDNADRGRGRYAQPSLDGLGRSVGNRSINEITDDVIGRGLDDAAIGAGLREATRGDSPIEAGIAYASIIGKALLARERRERQRRGTAST